MELIQKEQIDIVLVQEPYTFQNKLAGITRTHRTYINNEERSRAAIIIANAEIDALIITTMPQGHGSSRSKAQKYEIRGSKHVL
jgi:hypothetical protein